MATVEQLNEGIRRAGAAGDGDAVRALGAKLLRLRRSREATEFLRGLREAELPQPFPPGPRGESVSPRRQPGVSEFAGQGIARTLSAPFELAAMADRALGFPVGDRPFFGEARIADFMRNVTPVAGEFEQPETILQAGAQGLGLAGGFLLPGGAGVSAAIKFGGPVTRRVAKVIAEPFLKRPVRATAVELAAGAGAGAGGRLAEDRARETGQDTTATRIVGELLGGVAVAAGPGAVIPATVGLVRGTLAVGKAIPGVSLLANFIENAGRVVHSRLTKGGAFTRASRRLVKLSGDPEADAALVTSEGGIGGQSPAVETGNPRLMALERSVLDADATLDREFAREHGRGLRCSQGGAPRPCGRCHGRGCADVHRAAAAIHHQSA